MIEKRLPEKVEKGFRKRYKKIYRSAKPKLYTTSNGEIYLNPIKKALKGEKYINPEHEHIMSEEVKSAIEALNGYDNTNAEYNVD